MRKSHRVTGNPRSPARAHASPPEVTVDHPTSDAGSFIALCHSRAVVRVEDHPAHLVRASSLRTSRPLAVISQACPP